MIAWRIVKDKYAVDALTGEGAALFPGRWNRQGTPVVYCAETIALATLEILVHIGTEYRLSNHRLIGVEIDDNNVERLSAGDLPMQWRNHPAPEATQAFGDERLLASRAIALALPSVVIPREYNILINPSRSQSSNVKRVVDEPFALDCRF